MMRSSLFLNRISMRASKCVFLFRWYKKKIVQTEIIIHKWYCVLTN